MLKILAVAALLLGAPAAFSQTVSSCPTATAGSVWAKGAWLPCSTAVAYIAQPVPMTARVSDMRCPIAPATGACVFSWQLGPKVLPTDQVWAKTTASPTGTWVRGSTLKFASTPPPPCTILTYTGRPFTTVTASANNELRITGPVVGTVTLYQPLGANLNHATIVPEALDYTLVNEAFIGSGAGVTTFGGPGLYTGFAFSTDANGTITGWNVSIEFVEGGEDHPVTGITSTTTSDQAEASSNNLSSPTGPMSINGSSTSPGTWTCMRSFTSNFP